MTTTYAIPNGRTAMDATLWTGNGAARTILNTDTGTLGFLPDLTWIKARGGTDGTWAHRLIDTSRGAGYELHSSDTDAQVYSATTLTLFNSNGFNLGNASSVNQSGTTYVAWQWNAGSNTTVSNTSGTVTSTVSANTTAGFSIVKFTGTGANATVGHGLGATPALLIVKAYSASGNAWLVNHVSFADRVNGYLVLNTADAYGTLANEWYQAPNSTTFGVGVNLSGNTLGYVAYCWAQIDGFSSFGSWSGNANADGPFIYTGFRPKFLLYKQLNGSNSWAMLDSSRDVYNPEQSYLLANSASAEGTTVLVDFLSNGFKIRTNLSGTNGSGETMIYAAFAENPFKYANAR